MKQLTITEIYQYEILPVEWNQSSCLFETYWEALLPKVPVDLRVDQILYVMDIKYVGVNAKKEVFGASKNGVVYVSTIPWRTEIETEQQIHGLIENGVSPYEALAFMEL